MKVLLILISWLSTISFINYEILLFEKSTPKSYVGKIYLISPF